MATRIICQNCGEELPRDAILCPNCGAAMAVPDGKATPWLQPDPSPDEPAPTQSQGIMSGIGVQVAAFWAASACLSLIPAARHYGGIPACILAMATSAGVTAWFCWRNRREKPQYARGIAIGLMVAVVVGAALLLGMLDICNSLADELNDTKR